jgi:hypothetical protein
MSSMKESRAVALVFAAMMLTAVLVLSALALLEVSDRWIAVAILLITVAGADTISRVSMHYDQPRHRRR